LKFHEYILGNVIGQVPLAAESKRQPEHIVLVAAEQFSQGGAIMRCIEKQGPVIADVIV